MWKEQNKICGITWHNKVSRITKKGVIIKDFGCLKERKLDHSHLRLTSAHKPAFVPALWRKITSEQHCFLAAELLMTTHGGRKYFCA